jgi:hypothetical protein
VEFILSDVSLFGTFCATREVPVIAGNFFAAVRRNLHDHTTCIDLHARIA